MKKLNYLFSVLALGAFTLAEFPQAEINNGVIHARLYLPDTQKGYYQGTRFDWSGNMPKLEYNGHEYFGQWFTKYSPEIHDAIMGPVEDFQPIDFTEAKPGENFLKIGVGVLSKPDDKPYAITTLYPFINHGKWTVNKQTDQVQFIHELKDKDYSYEYKKIVQLIKDKPEMVISHTLKNTGNHTIETTVYDHNFFVIDNQPVGPDLTIAFPFNITGEGQGIGELAKIDNNQIIFLRKVNNGENVYCGALQGFSASEKDYDIKIENHKTGAGVRITCDKPLFKLVFWSCSTTACPEPYIKIKVEPGKEFSWKINYQFYTKTK
jgi:hypothetical protein